MRAVLWNWKMVIPLDWTPMKGMKWMKLMPLQNDQKSLDARVGRTCFSVRLGKPLHQGGSGRHSILQNTSVLIASSMLETRHLFVTGSIQESRSLQVYYTALHFRCPKTQQRVWYYIKWRPFSRVLLLFAKFQS